MFLADARVRDPRTLLGSHIADLDDVARSTAAQAGAATAELGPLGLIVLILRSYSMGAGTYTGIEAVSNGMPILREPRVQTARTTMRYMAASLAFVAFGPHDRLPPLQRRARARQDAQRRAPRADRLRLGQARDASSCS